MNSRSELWECWEVVGFDNPRLNSSSNSCRSSGDKFIVGEVLELNAMGVPELVGSVCLEEEDHQRVAGLQRPLPGDFLKVVGRVLDGLFPGSAELRVLGAPKISNLAAHTNGLSGGTDVARVAKGLNEGCKRLLVFG
jgi:hypothetical protein